MPTRGSLFGIGVGPGDPELLTVKASRLIAAADVVAFPTARHGRSIARGIAEPYLREDQVKLSMTYPVTTEASDHPGGYEGALSEFYDRWAATLSGHLDAGRDVAILCEGDPLFYGSYIYLHERLAPNYRTEVVPGVTSFSAAAASAGIPLARRDEVLSILPGTLPVEALASRLSTSDAAVVIKLGRNFAKVRDAARRAGVGEHAIYVERASSDDEQMAALGAVDEQSVPYMSLVLVPGARDAAHGAAGELAVVGLGPAGPEWLTPEAHTALARADVLVGYAPYLARVPSRRGQERRASDNRVELERAREALELALAGAAVAVVSSGDPGIFAMAAAVYEAVEEAGERFASVPVRIVPGVSAMQVAAARAGAPLGHDFCVISLSDQLKPWADDRTPPGRCGVGRHGDRALQPGLADAPRATRARAGSPAGVPHRRDARRAGAGDRQRRGVARDQHARRLRPRDRRHADDRADRLLADAGGTWRGGAGARLHAAQLPPVALSAAAARRCP